MNVDTSTVNRLLQQCSALSGYRLDRELGQGGMGAVYLIRDSSSAPVALKIMLHTAGANEKARARFVREISLTEQLRHDNVVRVLLSGECERVLYYTMEFCAGGSVENLRVGRGGHFGLAEAGGIILQVLDGLNFAHQKPIEGVELADRSLGTGLGVVHRDLKPANIFLPGLDANRPAKIADFGLSKALKKSGLTAFTPAVAWGGTPEFQPRQQVGGFREAGAEVDVWAAAASLYNMLTGEFPRNFSSSKDRFLTVMQSRPVPIRERTPTVPGPIAALLDRALDDSGEKLYFESAAEFRGELQAALAS
jgi:eukaryotic-like serine/threonine-protein kinase